MKKALAFLLVRLARAWFALWILAAWGVLTSLLWVVDKAEEKQLDWRFALACVLCVLVAVGVLHVAFHWGGAS